MSQQPASGMKLPQHGIAWEELAAKLDAMKTNDADWRRGRLPSYTYYVDDDLLEKQTEAYAKYIVENALGAGLVFPSIDQMQADIFSMGFDLFNAPVGAGASFTSGGTESVFQAVKTCRDQARALRGEPRGNFNVVAGINAHPALDKAAQILDLEVRRTPLDGEYRATAAAMEAATDERTIMLYGSAPSYPFGLFDRLEEISDLALRKDLWLHVDACWGGFVSPFAKSLGYSIPEWDMVLPGVTSLSADVHKFGYAVKGASLIIYRDAAVQKYEAFEFSDWPRGTYWTPTFGGSKPAGSVASAWAIMQYLGRKGYERATRDTMKATMDLISGVNQIDGLKALEPYGEGNLFCFVSTDPTVDIMAVADILEARGWIRGRMREPLGIHQGVVASHLPFVDDYLGEIRRAVNEVRASGKLGAFKERTY